MPKVTEAHKEGRRRQILRAAHRCFSRRGFQQTSMQDICRQAKLSPGAVYSYFPSKAKLIEALAKIGRDQTAELIAQTKTTSLDLSVFTSRLLQRLNQDASLPVFRLDVRLWAEAIHTPELRTLIRDSQARVMELLGAVLKSAEPTFTNRLQRQALAQLLVALIAGFELQRVIDPTVDLEPAIDTMKKLLEKF